MKRVRNKLISFLVLISLALALSFSPAQVAQAQTANQISYILFATDGYIQLPDGVILYMYGFVGGRSTDYVVYQNSMIAPPKAPKGYVPGGLVDGTPVTPPAVGTGMACQGLTWLAAAGNAGCLAQLAGNSQFPAPIIRSAVGDAVEIRLKNLGVTDKNAPNDPHSIHLHGLDVNAANDGVPETSVGAIPLNAPMPGAGNTIYYYFTPQQAGSYMYHCHQ
jgi:FtsP/CotA-like multicopper oxidase with cupredoxin domain